jgi:hypothetical protein
MNPENRMRACTSVTRTRIATLLVGAAVAALSCGDPSPTTPDLRVPAPQANFSGWKTGLVACKPLAYDSATELIGPGGGELRVGKHVLSIPGGALRDWVSITVVAPADTVNRIQFQPEGLVFRKPVQLTMSYVNCNIGPSAQPTQIAYTDDSLVVLEYEPSVDDVVGKKVTGLLSHFSGYAISW